MKRLAVLTVVLAGCASGGAAPATDAGPLAPADAGGCPACAPPDAGECGGPGASCSAAGCCPGYACSDGGGCVALENPCPDGEVILANGCGCDPELGVGCAPGFVCGPDLHCDRDAGFSPLPAGQPVGAPCDPAAAAGDAGPPCETPDGSLPVDCVPDPSGVSLYACAQGCSTDADCPLAWQSCGSSFAAPGHCGDTPCSALSPSPGPAFFNACRLPGGESGLCLPFSLSVVENGTAQALGYGLCVQGSADAGIDAPCGSPPVRGGDGGLCNPEQVCVLGSCRTPCNALDAGSCLAPDVCVPAGFQAPAPGAFAAAGGCVPPCELDGGCDAGAPPAGDAGPGDGGAPDAGVATGAVDGGDGGTMADGGLGP